MKSETARTQAGVRNPWQIKAFNRTEHSNTVHITNPYPKRLKLLFVIVARLVSYIPIFLEEFQI
jgi:hypothetical protein